jgi:hypothetical protein
MKNIRYWYSDTMDWIRYRTYDRYNIIKITSLPPDYSDPRERLLHGSFDLLVDFIESEKAHMERCWGRDKTTRSWKDKLYLRLPHILRHLPMWNSRELGLAYLDWEISLENDPEMNPPKTEEEKKEFAEKYPYAYTNLSQWYIAKEEKELYLWWTVERPNRPEPMDASGWSAFCDKNRDRIHKWKKCTDSDCFEMYDELTEEEKEEQRKLLDETWRIEYEQEKEDEEMLIRLAKIRLGLWT